MNYSPLWVRVGCLYCFVYIHKIQSWILLFFYPGYLNENGHLNLRNFEKYLEKLSEVRQHTNTLKLQMNEYKFNVANHVFLLLCWNVVSAVFCYSSESTTSRLSDPFVVVFMNYDLGMYSNKPSLEPFITSNYKLFLSSLTGNILVMCLWTWSGSRVKLVTSIWTRRRAWQQRRKLPAKTPTRR